MAASARRSLIASQNAQLQVAAFNAARVRDLHDGRLFPQESWRLNRQENYISHAIYWDRHH
jgi:hypothetical protein